MQSRQSVRLQHRNPLAQLTDQVGNMSIGKPGEARRSTLGRSSLGRQSLYARQSMSATTATTIKDPRPIKDKRFQQNAAQKLIQFLLQSGYPQPVSQKTFSSPSSKDFQMIFKFLYAQLDPYYVFERKFEEEVPILLKGLRYPFADQINKSNLFTVGSLHAWPTLLAMLIWMVELILSVDQLDAEQEAEANDETKQAEKMFLDYLSKAYTMFLNGTDNNQVIDQHLLDNFEQKDAQVKQDLEKIRHDLEVFGKEWHHLSNSESPLTILEREKAILESDNEKYKAYIEHLEAKKQKLSETVVSLKEEFKSSQLMVQNLEEERVRLTNIIDQQEISPADVDRMNAERDQLSKSIALVCEQLDVVNKQVWNKEIEIQKKMDTIERLSEKCNSLLYQLDLIGNTTAQFECLSQELSIYIQNQKAEDMCSINLRKQAKPAIHSLLESIKATTNQVMDESIALQEQIDLAGWNVVTKEEEIAAKQSLIKQMNEQYVNEKQQISNELLASSKEIEHMERTIQQLKNESNYIALQSKTRLQKAQRQYDDTIKRMTNERDQLLNQTAKALGIAFNFGTHISDGLEDMQKRIQDSIDAIDL